MKKTELLKMIKSTQRSLKKHSPEILTGIGIAGMITTTVIAVRATPKALALIEEKKQTEETEDLTPTETVKTTWKCYVPATITGILSIACLIGAGSVNHRKNAALATAYSLSESALKEYSGKVVEMVGDKKEQKIRDELAKDKVEHNPVRDKEVIITDKGDTLCYDVISGRYFKSDIDKIKKSVNELNRRMITEMSISLNDLYYELGLDNVLIGDELGWNIENNLIDLSFSSQLAKDETPCLVIDYKTVPKYGYY